jgi:hypothetical protein
MGFVPSALTSMEEAIGFLDVLQKTFPISVILGVVPFAITDEHKRNATKIAKRNFMG